MGIEAERNVENVLAVLPKEFGLRQVKVNDDEYEIRNEKCILKFFFERFISSSVVILIFDPHEPSDDGMKFLVLRHLLHAKNKMDSTTDRFTFVGETIVDCMQPLLEGDFSVRKSYNDIENRFFDSIDDVMSLPNSHPAKQLFDDCNIDWIEAIKS